jgi:outer membrane protein
MTCPTKSFAPVVIGSLACGMAAAADGDNVVKLAASRYDTHSSTSGIVGSGVPPGADASTGDATTLVFAYERMLGANLAIELVMGVPPTIKADATGSIAPLGNDILSARAIAPTLLLSYHFGDAQSRLRPYVGAGVNYTHFTDIRSKLGDAHLSDSTGLALELGVHYAITKEWGVFASVVKVDAKTRLSTSGGADLSTTIDLKPMVHSAGISYSF